MSKVYTDSIEKRTGGSAITVPASGQWIDLASAAQGDVLYHNGTSYVRLPAGTSGQFLKTLGTGANPAWAADSAGSLVYLASSRSAVDTNTVEFQSFKSTDYLYYKIVGLVQCTTSQRTFNMRLMQGSTIITNSEYYGGFGGNNTDGTAIHSYANAAAVWTFWTGSDSDFGQQFELNLRLEDASSVFAKSSFEGQAFGYFHNDVFGQRQFGGFKNDSDDDVDGVVFSWDSGDINFHNIVVYGMKGS